MAIPASIVRSESAFSTRGRIVSDYRSRLTCSTVEVLICLQDWLKAAGMYVFYLFKFSLYLVIYLVTKNFSLTLSDDSDHE